MIFAGGTFDYFGNSAEPTQFSMECVDCAGTVELSLGHISIDNSSDIHVKFSGEKITNSGINVTV